MATVLIFSVVLSMMGLSIVVMATTESMISHNHRLKGEAFYAAEGGLEKQIADLVEISSDGSIPTQSELLSISQVPPDFEGYTFEEYGVARDGDAYMSTITLGPYAGLYALVQPYHMVSSVIGPENARVFVERSSEHHLIPVFQFGVFYDRDLEILPGPVMRFGGRVHTNRDLYVGCNVDMYFDSFVTAAGSIVNDRKDQIMEPEGDVWFQDDRGNYRRMAFDSRDPDWEEKAIRLWGGRVQDQAHGIVPIGLPLPAGVEPIEILRRGEIGDPAELREARFYYKAGLRIIDGVATDGDGMPVNLDEDILSTHTFYNFREEKWLTATELDVEALIEAGRAPENGIIYISASETLPGRKDAVVRLVNGEELPAGGLTVATDNPLYIQGDYNVENPQPASVLTDAINILSNAWDDERSHQGIGKRKAAPTSIRVAIMAGNLETTIGNYNGGLENFLRFLEKWDGRRLTYTGSLVCMWNSEWATGPWHYGGEYYTAPQREWSFDTNFYDPDLLPPGTPNILNFEPGEWIYE
jgi:hypothetical protein